MSNCRFGVSPVNYPGPDPDKIKCLIIGHSMKFNFKFQLTFLGSCNYVLSLC